MCHSVLQVEVAQPLSKLCAQFPDLYIGKSFFLPRSPSNFFPSFLLVTLTCFLGYEGGYRRSREGPVVITFEGKVKTSWWRCHISFEAFSFFINLNRICCVAVGSIKNRSCFSVVVPEISCRCILWNWVTHAFSRLFPIVILSWLAYPSYICLKWPLNLGHINAKKEITGLTTSPRQWNRRMGSPEKGKKKKIKRK